MRAFPAFFLILAMTFAGISFAQEDDSEEYVDIPADLATGMLLLDVAERAHDNRDDYYEPEHGHPRNEDHEHGNEPQLPVIHIDEQVEPLEPDEEIEYTEDLTAYDAVGEIYLNAMQMDGIDREARDIVKVVVAVVDAWHQCDDTFLAVKRGVEIMPERADEIAAAVAIKKDCNCAAGGMWPRQRVETRVRAALRQVYIEVSRACSCSQVAMLGAITALPYNQEFVDTPEEDEAERARITGVMVEKSKEIIDRVNAAQNRNDWDCGCANVNLAATMRGIYDDDLRGGTWDGLRTKYTDEAGDNGLVVDVFGTVGAHPASAWGNPDINSAEYTLRRKPTVFRGDPLLMDPFDPAREWFTYTDNDPAGLMAHEYKNDPVPTDIFLSEYIEGWNAEALAKPADEREPEERNKVLELYNGSDKDIDLGNDQYFLEIYGAGTVPVAPPPPVLRTNNITLESGVTFELDKWEVRPEAAATLQSIANTINEADIFSELLIVGHTCDIATDEYNQLLSERRAESVREYLEGLGVDVETIRTEGHGEREPRLPNTSEENRSQNRRIEISFVTRGDRVIQRTEREADGRKYYEFSWAEVDKAATAAAAAVIPIVFGDEQWVEGDRDPREVIGLNGQIEARGTFVIAYDNSDEEITEIADIVTGQLDFIPSDTLVIRRFGGARALACKAHTYSMLMMDEGSDGIFVGIPEPLTPLPEPLCTDPTQCPDGELGSPN